MVPTFEHYIEEIKYEEQIMIGKNNEIAMNGLRYILNSLTPNARLFIFFIYFFFSYLLGVYLKY